MLTAMIALNAYLIVGFLYADYLDNLSPLPSSDSGATELLSLMLIGTNWPFVLGLRLGLRIRRRRMWRMAILPVSELRRPELAE